jgi:NAD(P)-dependent dehydrogenase (short-subunit alcohol dehydrogenase family)
VLEVLGEILNRARADLDRAGVDYALIGGLAIGARTVLRFTQDADLTIAIDNDAQAERLARDLLGRGYQLAAEIDHTPTGRMAILRLISPAAPAGRDPADTPLLDLLIHSIGIEQEVVAQAQPVEVLTGVILPTARVPHLIAMKVLAESDQRLQDRIDLQQLILVATEADLDEVPLLLDKITQRGFAYDKDLHAVYEGFLKAKP